MILVITEKPSVAQSLARVIGADKRNEGNVYLDSWCIGHLIESVPLEAYDEKLRKWRYEGLPVLPQEWKYNVLPGAKNWLKS